MILNYFNNVKGNRQGEFFLLPAHGTGGARATPFLAALFAKQKTKFGGGGNPSSRTFRVHYGAGARAGKNSWWTSTLKPLSFLPARLVPPKF